MNQNLQLKLNLLKKIFPDFHFNANNQEFIVFCPKHLHHKKKLQISLKKDVFACWVCSYRGTVLKLLKDLGRRDLRTEYAKLLNYTFLEKDDTIDLLSNFRDFSFISPKMTYDGINVVDFLRSEYFLNDEKLYQNKILFATKGKYANRAIFPSFDNDGYINYFMTRGISPYQKKYLPCEGTTQKVVFNELFVDWQKPIILVEGFKPYFKHFGIPNLVPLLGSRIYKNSRLIEKMVLNDTPTVFLCLDYDARLKAMNAILELKNNGINVKFVNIDSKPQELSSPQLIEKLLCAEELNDVEVLSEKIMGA